MGGGQWSGQWRPERTLLLSLFSLQWRRNQSLVSQTVLFLLSPRVLCSLTFFIVSSPSTKPPTCGHLTNMLFRRPSSFYHARAVSVVLCVARICFPYIVNHLCSLGRAFSSGTGGGGGGKDTRLLSELGTSCCVKAEGRRVGLSHATSLRTSEWPSARRIWREREERECERRGEASAASAVYCVRRLQPTESALQRLLNPRSEARGAGHGRTDGGTGREQGHRRVSC